MTEDTSATPHAKAKITVSARNSNEKAENQRNAQTFFKCPI